MADHPSTSNNTSFLPSTANQSGNDNVSNSDNPNSTNHNPSNSDQSQNSPVTNAGPANPTTGPVAMGYPPAYGQPYYPYGPHSGAVAAPPAVFSGSVAGGGERNGSSFVRGFLAMLLILTVLSCVASITTWLILCPQVPILRVESFAVTGLNVSGPEIWAQWEARLAAENPNKKLRVYLDQVQGYVYHKEDFLSSAPVDPVFLPTQGRETLVVRLRSGGQRPAARWVSGDVAGELRGGAVEFNLRLLVLATFKSGQWWTKHTSMKVFCDDLRVGFPGGNVSAGALDVGDSPKRCFVYYA